MPFDYQMVTFEEIIKNDFFKWTQVFKFRKWFKYGLMAQKFQKQHALKGQKLLAQGNALGMLAISNTPCKGTSFKKSSTYNIFPSSDTRNRILAPPHFMGSLELKY